MNAGSGVSTATDYLVAATVAVSIVLGLMGYFMGSIAGLAILAQPPGRTTTISQLPRLKNLGWLVGGSFGLLLADTGKLQLPSGFSMTWPWLAYLAGVVGAVGQAHVQVFFQVSSAVRRHNRNRSEALHLDRHTLLLEYMLNGKDRYEARWAELVKVADAAAVEQRRKDELGELRRTANKLVVTNVSAALHFLRSTNTASVADTDSLVDSIMESVRTIVIAYADGRLAGEEATVRVTVMKYVSASSADAELKARRLFVEGMPDDYDGDLVMKYPPLLENEAVILPVARKKINLLPGAPRAHVLAAPQIMDIRKKGFPTECPNAAVDGIRSHFERPYFDGIKSITSIPVRRRHEGVGVLNIETSQPMLVGATKPLAATVADRLQVPIALLSVLI